jgi:hypothetical protein
MASGHWFAAVRSVTQGHDIGSEPLAKALREVESCIPCTRVNGGTKRLLFQISY